MLGYLVDKCHVSESFLGVVRYMLSKVKGGHKAWMKLPRNARREALVYMLARHNSNKGLYNSVASGRF